MDQPQLIVGMKIVVSATHAFKTLLLSLMEKEKKKKEKKEKDFSFVLGDRCYFLPVIFLYLFLSFFFYFANHYYSASRRMITFLLRFLQPVTKIFFFLFLSRTIYLGTSTHFETDRNRLRIRWEIAIKRDLPFFFFPSIRTVIKWDTSSS